MSLRTWNTSRCRENLQLSTQLFLGIVEHVAHRAANSEDDGDDDDDDISSLSSLSSYDDDDDDDDDSNSGIVSAFDLIRPLANDVLGHATRVYLQLEDETITFGQRKIIAGKCFTSRLPSRMRVTRLPRAIPARCSGHFPANFSASSTAVRLSFSNG